METPLEAIAFNYASFGIFTVANNLWTWIAVVTAAVSVWRFKATVTFHRHPPPPQVLSSYENCKKLENDVRYHQGHDKKPSLLKVEDEKIKAPSSSSSTTTTSTSSCATTWPSFCEDGVRKGRKFMVCYYNEEEENDDEVVKKGKWEEEEEGNNLFDVCERLRMKEMGMYDFQDLRMLNGNVVRLWDDDYYYYCSNARLSMGAL